MPNYTENHLHVSGSVPSLKRFAKFTGIDLDNIEKSKFLFNNIISMPERLKIDLPFNSDSPFVARMRKENKKLYGYEDWYAFRNEVWGCKWDIEPSETTIDYSADEDYGALLIVFMTAWNGPEGICRELMELFPDLHISWECLNEDDIDYEPTPENTEDFIDGEDYRNDVDGMHRLSWERQKNVYELTEIC